MNITILLAIACGLIFFHAAVVITLKWSYVALKEERRKMKGGHKDAGSDVERDI